MTSTATSDTEMSEMHLGGTSDGSSGIAADDATEMVGAARALVGAAIFSEQPAKLGAFYGMLLGMRFERRQHADGREHRIADLGPVHFEIKAVRQGDGRPTPDAVTGSEQHSSIELSFDVPDAAASYDYALTLGATEHQPVETYPWGTFGVVLDPDGNRLGLYSPPADQPQSDDKEGA